jgi:hypothetical protein
MKHFTLPQIIKALVMTSFSALSLLIISPAQAVVINFDALDDNVSGTVGDTYTQNGFTIRNSPGTAPYNFGLAYWGNQMPQSPGSTSLFNNTGTTTILSQVGGGAFTLLSIDLADLTNITSAPATFTGFRADNSTVTQNLNTDSLPGLQTFNFSNFTNLVSVNISNASVQFTNICIDSGCSTATAVPEPFTVLGTIFGAGYGVALKRKLAKAKQEKEDIS